MCISMTLALTAGRCLYLASWGLSWLGHLLWWSWFLVSQRRNNNKAMIATKPSRHWRSFHLCALYGFVSCLHFVNVQSDYRVSFQIGLLSNEWYHQNQRVVGVPVPLSWQNAFIIMLQLIKFELFTPEGLERIWFIFKDPLWV